MIPLWRTKPIKTTNSTGRKFPPKFVFPSGRQALTHCLKHAGLTRTDRVAVPEWSSHCVISAVGKIATPIPMNEVITQDLDVKAVLIYDQWGWPVFDNSYKDIQARFSNKILIHDRVDSMNVSWFSNESVTEEKYTGFQSIYQVFSLSKTLGLSGGGLASCNSEWLEFSISNEHEILVQLLDKVQNRDKINYSLKSNFMKSDIAALPTSLQEWLNHNDIISAYEKERKKRKKNVLKIIKSGLTKDWPSWLIDSIEGGNEPCIVPLFKKANDERLISEHDKLLSRFDIETSIYHFDWNGNPLFPDYGKCLALPVHGQINNIFEI